MLRPTFATLAAGTLILLSSGSGGWAQSDPYRQGCDQACMMAQRVLTERNAPAPPPRAHVERPRFAAIVVDQNTGIAGWAYGATSSGDTKAKAIESCFRRVQRSRAAQHPDTCKAVVYEVKQCSAYALSSDQLAIQDGHTTWHASQAALAACQRRGPSKDCRVLFSLCAWGDVKAWNDLYD